MRRIRNITGLMLFISCLAIMSRAQSVATITAVIKDTTGANVGSGKVTFDQIPNIATTDGTSIFTPLTVTCKIIAGGVLKANDSVSPCQLVYNPTNSPAGTFYKTTYYPLNAKTAVMNLFVSAASQDISTILQTPATMPAYNIVDLVSTQTVAGNKTFSGANTISGVNTFTAIPIFTLGIQGVAGQTLALPSTAGSLASNNNTLTFTGKTFDTAAAGNSLLINGLAATTNTGTGAIARAASPQLTGTDSGVETLVNKTLNLPTLVTPTASNSIFTTGIYADGSGLKHKRIASCTTGAVVLATCNTVLNWGTAFADANYSVTCTIELIANNPFVVGTFSKAAASVGIQIASITAANASGTIDCIAIHD
jgi:hypothetical protein